MHNFTKYAFAAVLIMLATPLLIPAAASATRIGHSVLMRGSIIDVTDGKPTICIGKADGAKVGQTLDVVRISSKGEIKGNPKWRRLDVGTIRIDAIVDDHFAVASVVKGDVAKHDLVELRKN